MINFSIILNSRNRPVLLQNLLNSILWTTSDTSKIEVLISADTDDIETQLFYNRYNPIWNGYLPSFASIEYVERDRNLHRRLNNLVRKAKGEYILVLNDDVTITTNNWDIIALNCLSNKDWCIKYGHTYDNSCDKEGVYSSFPIISKKIIDILGFIFPEVIVGLGADVILHRLFMSLNKIIDIPININHILHSTIEQVINPDITAKEMREFTHQNYINPHIYNIDLWIDILNQYIKCQKN